MDLLEIFRTYKIYKEGDGVSTCYSICLWGIYCMLGMIIYASISGNNMIAIPFLVTSLLTLSVLLFAFFLLYRQTSRLTKTKENKTNPERI